MSYVNICNVEEIDEHTFSVVSRKNESTFFTLLSKYIKQMSFAINVIHPFHRKIIKKLKKTKIGSDDML